MPWKESDRVSERLIFISRLRDGERMSDLCAEYGITRTTGYKWKERYAAEGPEGLAVVDLRGGEAGEAPALLFDAV